MFRTDGDPEPVATELRNAGVAIFAIKVGSLVKQEYLTRLTGDGQRVFSASSSLEMNLEFAKTIVAATTGCTQRDGVVRQS